MNTMFLQDLVKGKYGRKIAYTDLLEITEQNVVKVVADCIGVFNWNKPIIKYLWDYKNGDQPILYRRKIVRDDVINRVVENHAWEIVRFKNGQTNGEPIQCVSSRKEDWVNEAVDKLNRYLKAANKQVKDIMSGEWTSAVGTGYEAVQKVASGSAVPFRIVAPNPMNTFIIYSKSTQEPLLSVQEFKDENGEWYRQCFSDRYEFIIKNGSLLPFETNADGVEVYSRLHVFGAIPIVEKPNNQDRISDIELVITMLDAINNMQSNRMDAIEQFVQSWVKFVNCQVDKDTFQEMKMMGALVVKSNNGENKADVDIMTQELNQSESQIAKDDLWNNALAISAIPNKQGNTGGDTQGAVELRNGWDFSKQSAKLKDPFIVEAEQRLMIPILNLIRIEKGAKECPLTLMDFDIQINHSPTDNMQVKSQVYQMLVSAGIHPLIAIKTCGLWGDSEKVYLLSKPYLDVLYKTIDEVVEDAEGQQKKAERLVDEFNNQKDKETAE